MHEPDVACLTFRVMDEDVVGAEFMAFSSLPLSCVRPGLRTVPLRGQTGRQGTLQYASLLVHIQMTPLPSSPIVTTTAVPAVSASP